MCCCNWANLSNFSYKRLARHLGTLVLVLGAWVAGIYIEPTDGNGACRLDGIDPTPGFTLAPIAPRPVRCAWSHRGPLPVNFTANATAVVPEGACSTVLNDLTGKIGVTWSRTCNTIEAAQRIEAAGAVGVVLLEAWDQVGYSSFSHYEDSINVNIPFLFISRERIVQGFGDVYGDLLYPNISNQALVHLESNGENAFDFIALSISAMIGLAVIGSLALYNVVLIIVKLVGFAKARGCDLSMATVVLPLELINNLVRIASLAVPPYSKYRPRYFFIWSGSFPVYFGFVSTTLLLFFLRELLDKKPKVSKFLRHKRSKIVFFAASFFMVGLDQTAVALNALYVTDGVTVFAIHLLFSFLFQLIVGIVYVWYASRLLSMRARVLATASRSKVQTFDERLWENVLLTGACMLLICTLMMFGVLYPSDTYETPKGWTVLAIVISGLSILVSTYKIKLFNPPQTRERGYSHSGSASVSSSSAKGIALRKGSTSSE